MRIVSLSPSATEIVHALGVGDSLVGRSHACDFPEQVLGLPEVTRLDADSSRVHLRGRILATLRPDLVLTEGSEDEALVDYEEVSAVVAGMPRETTLVASAPLSIEGIFHSVSTIGAFTETETEALGLVELLRERMLALDLAVRTRRRRVVVLEALDPPRAAGRWVPEMVRRAGGWELLGREGEPALTVSWQQVRDVEPEVIIVALRDADASAAVDALRSAALPPWFDELEAVREGAFFAVDGHGLFARPGPRVVDGIAALAELFEPELFADAGPVASWLPLPPLGIAGAGPGTGRPRPATDRGRPARGT
jgi:iron complex transport system substrate-binding protein